jgi:hypothetical protein
MVTEFILFTINTIKNQSFLTHSAMAAQLIFGTFVTFLNILLSEGKLTF